MDREVVGNESKKRRRGSGDGRETGESRSFERGNKNTRTMRRGQGVGLRKEEKERIMR